MTHLQARRVLREVNAAVREINRGFGSTTGTLLLMCECGVLGCLQRFEVPAPTFDRVAATEGWLVAAAHQPDEDERVVEEGTSYRLIADELKAPSPRAAAPGAVRLGLAGLD